MTTLATTDKAVCNYQNFDYHGLGRVEKALLSCAHEGANVLRDMPKWGLEVLYKKGNLYSKNRWAFEFSDTVEYLEEYAEQLEPWRKDKDWGPIRRFLSMVLIPVMRERAEAVKMLEATTNYEELQAVMAKVTERPVHLQGLDDLIYHHAKCVLGLDMETLESLLDWEDELPC